MSEYPSKYDMIVNDDPEFDESRVDEMLSQMFGSEEEFAQESEDEFLNDTPEIIYLASPYTHPDKTVMARRLQKAYEAAGWLLSMGRFVYSPICHTVPLVEHCGLPAGYEFWRGFNHELIQRFDKVIVLQLRGWEDSVGVKDEIEFAKSIGKPIEYMEDSHER